MTGKDWVAWHEPYDVPGSPLAHRLELVQSHLTDALDAAPSGAIRLVSVCAGQGRDVIGVLADHPRSGDVSARLVEQDETNVAIARQAADTASVSGVEVVAADGSIAGAYAPTAPADVVVFCGVLGNVADTEIPSIIPRLPELCREGATVIWTRHRRPPDATPMVRDAFSRSGFVETRWDAPEDSAFGVGSHRLSGVPPAFDPDQQLFTFVADTAQTWQRPGPVSPG